MGAQLDRLRYEVFQNLFYSPMNTVFLRPAIATVLTVYGIETRKRNRSDKKSSHIATVLTVYGIETLLLLHSKAVTLFYRCNSAYRLQY